MSDVASARAQMILKTGHDIETPEGWLAYYIEDWERNAPRPMGKALAMAIWGRLDAHGRDRCNGTLYPMLMLRAAHECLRLHWNPPSAHA